jgi:glycosyltransferase involved in cell wall biosynthesis
MPLTRPPASAETLATDLPSVSVIVPTYNRSATLADTLAALLAQDYPADRLEVIVVDNASTDDTAAVVEAARRPGRAPIRYFRKENRGPAAARNYGVARALGAALAFTDSDCTMRPDWLRTAVGAFAPGVGLVAGPVRPVVNPRRIPSFFYHQTDHRAPNGIYPTANILYRREVFDRLGGFDEQFGAYSWGPPIGGEDIDLAWRAQQAGYRAVWAEAAAVDHEASSIPIKAWLLEPVKAQIMPRMVASYPGLRDSLHWRLFTGRENGPFYLALVGLLLALTRRPGLGAALALPWLWVMHPMVDRDLWPPARWWRIPVKYALMVQRFGLLGATLAWASLRNRTVVL